MKCKYSVGAGRTIAAIQQMRKVEQMRRVVVGRSPQPAIGKTARQVFIQVFDKKTDW